MIDDTYKQHGNGPGGIISVTTKSRSVQVWSNSLPVFTDLMRNFDVLRERYPVTKIKHKEECKDCS